MSGTAVDLRPWLEEQLKDSKLTNAEAYRRARQEFSLPNLSPLDFSRYYYTHAKRTVLQTSRKGGKELRIGGL